MSTIELCPRRFFTSSRVISQRRGLIGLSAIEEDHEPVGQLGGRLLGHMMATIDGIDVHIVGPPAPDRERVAVQSWKVIAG